MKSKWIFEKGSMTVRTVPENYCVTALRTFGDGGTTDAAIGDLVELGNLISAAPEMLKIIKRIISSAPITGLPLALEKDIQSASNIILKAEGVK